MSDAKVHIARFTGYNVVRILLGLILLTTAVLKAHQLATEPVVGVGLLDSRWLLIGVVEFELLFGLTLLAGIFPKSTWIVALACFACFAGVSAAKAVSGDASCGCFGKVPVNPWYTLGLDLTVIGALLRWQALDLVPRYGTQGFAPLPCRVVAVGTLWLAAGIPAGLAMGMYQAAAVNDAGSIVGDGEFVVLEPETWIDKRFPLLEHVAAGDQLARGPWVVLLYRPGCALCDDVLASYETFSDTWEWRSADIRVALIAVESAPQGHGVRIGSFGAIHGKLDPSRTWIIETPTEISLADGVVISVNEKHRGESRGQSS